ncbi:MAG TPA: hypothetical protein VFY96_00905 [Candidatus Binatia bacterium]|nr:hypothetical protein [Candidatus Binatia bacterium]
MTPPSVQDIDRIAELRDPVVRNLQITQCYHEISQCVAERTGFCANWCTFATWASRQAGQTIRQEDLIRAFEERFFLSPEISATLEDINAKLTQLGARLQAGFSAKEIFQAFNPAAAFARASAAVARGNKKVFEEIGFEFARFLQTVRVGNRFDRDQTARFCAALRPGDPPDGQRLLREAFAAYSEASVQDGKQKAELMLLANIAAGYHEQIRLQPEIAEALNASVAGAMDFKRSLLTRLVAHFHLREDLLTRRLPHLDALFGRLSGEVNRLIRQVITDHLMTLHLSSTAVLRLGRDLSGEFPQSLVRLHNPRLAALLAEVDLTPESLNATGATDWANFQQRMHFIADFFRVYQERQYLFETPFSAPQIELLKMGRRPDGPL